MESIHIVTTSSDSFAIHSAVMIHSLLENLASEKEVNIYILHSYMSQQNQLKLNRAVNKFNVELHFLPVNESRYHGCKKGRRMTKEAYYRLSIPELLKQNINKAIYLDSDLIVRADIAPLWNIDIDHYFLAAVQDPGARKYRRYSALTIPKSSGYFNSGVMVINIKKWREHDISNKVIQFIKENPKKILLLDQDGLNKVLQDKWMPLNPKWNYQTAHIGKLIIEPSIIHYTTRKKPWNSDHPLSKAYFQYSSKTLWDQDI